MNMRAGLGLGFRKAFVGKRWWPELSYNDRCVLAGIEGPMYVCNSWPADGFITEEEHQEAMWGV